MFIGTWGHELRIKYSAYFVRNYSDLVIALNPRCNFALLAWCGLQKLAAERIMCKWDQSNMWDWWPSGSKKRRPVTGLCKVDCFQTFCSYQAYPSYWKPTETSTQQAYTQLHGVPGINLTALDHLAKREVYLTQYPKCPMAHLPLVFKSQVLYWNNREVHQGFCRKGFIHQGQTRSRGW